MNILKKVFLLVLAISIISCSFAGFVYANETESDLSSVTFRDLSNSGEKIVDKLYCLGVLSEYDMKLDAYGELTRAEFVEMVINLLDYGTVEYSDSYFDDVPDDYWANGYINAAYQLGLISQNNTFRPTVDRFTNISSLLFDSNGSYGNTKVYLDYIKLEVIKPGVEVFGTAVDNCEEGRFVNGGLTLKAAVGTSYRDASKEISILVAKYNSDNALIDVEFVGKTISGGDCIVDLDDEVTITSDVQTIKLFVWDLNNVTPYMDSTVLTRAE